MCKKKPSTCPKCETPADTQPTTLEITEFHFEASVYYCWECRLGFKGNLLLPDPITTVNITALLLKAWKELTDIPVDRDECIEERFVVLGTEGPLKAFPAGTNKYEIWQWFDREFPLGLVETLLHMRKQ